MLRSGGMGCQSGAFSVYMGMAFDFLPFDLETDFETVGFGELLPHVQAATLQILVCLRIGSEIAPMHSDSG